MNCSIRFFYGYKLFLTFLNSSLFILMLKWNENVFSSSLSISLVLLIYTFPFLFSLQIGNWVQKIDKRRFLMTLPLIRFFLLLLLIFFGNHLYWLSFVFMILDSSLSVFSNVTDRIIPPLLVQIERLVQTNSWINGIETSMMLLANLCIPFLILMNIPLRTLLLIIASLLILVSLCMYLVPKVDERFVSELKKQDSNLFRFRSFSTMKNSLLSLWKSYDHAFVNVICFSFFLLWSVHASTKEIYAVSFMVDELNLGAESYGFFKSSFRFGNLFIIPFVPFLYRILTMKTIILIPLIIYLVYFFFFGFKMSMLILVIITFVIGCVTSLSFTSITSYLQIHVQQEKHGEIFGLFSLFTKFIQFPMIILMSTLFHYIGFFSTTIFFFILTLLISFYCWFLFKHTKPSNG